MSDNALARTRRLLVLIPAAWKAGERGLTLDAAARLTGTTVDQVRKDLEALDGLSLAPAFPEHELLLEIENDRIHASLTMQLVEPPGFALREGAALLAALRPFERDGGPAVRSASRKLRQAIPAYLRGSADELARATDFQVSPPGEWADALQEAIDRRVEVTMEYRATATADATRKALEPRLLFAQEGHWYLAAWNVEKQEEHLYRLDRVVSVVLGDRVFGRHQGPPAERYAKGRLYFESGTERAVKVRFRGVAAKLAAERWRAEPQPDGSVVVTAKLTPGPYLYGWVLGFGGEAEVVEPADVRDAFLAHVEELRSTYSAVPAKVGA
ncbi:YafY family protein [Anaeromyxobacter sp. SG66]|uniref:helix-turn-helix transcriptional regulator n=1 Tax=Anaeromyxobacter sp. SG66 TaxID=2925410 RepID=UPI001F5A6612|nr:WYL domain-containing protein [Anaeromyxobacter sp. SG66]